MKRNIAVKKRAVSGSAGVSTFATAKSNNSSNFDLVGDPDIPTCMLASCIWSLKVARR